MAKVRQTDVIRAMVSREIFLKNGRKLLAAADKRFPPTVLDKVAGKISAGWRNARDLDRMSRTILAGGYDITRTSRIRRSRRTGADGGADMAADDSTLWSMREICRDHDRNSALLHGIIDRTVDNVTAPAYGFRPDSDDESFNTAARDILAETAAVAEYRGIFSFQDVLSKGFRSLLPDGDYLQIDLADNRVQIIEAHDLVTPYTKKGFNGRRVVGGVELDDRGVPTAYYVSDPTSPDYKYSTGWISNLKDAQRIDAADAIHVANRDRFTATRGVPVLASSLGLFDRFDGYLDAETLAAELAAHLAWFIERDSTAANPYLQGTESREDPNETDDSESTYDKVLRSEPGKVFDLRPGEKVGVLNNIRPGETFDPYVSTMLRMIGAGVGLPLELVLLDFSKTTYSSARAALLQAYRTFLRWQVFVRTYIIQPTYTRWMTRWIARRDLAPVKNAFRLKTFPPRWAWIDPLKAVLEAQKRIAAGAGTLEDWIADENRVMSEVFETREKELAELRRRRIPTTTAPDNLSQASSTGAPGNAE